MKASPGEEGFPPLYYTRLRRATRRWWSWFGVTGALSLWTGASLVWDFHNPLAPLAPIFGALWIYSTVVAFATRDDAKIARVVPYFPKEAAHVEADTHFHGHALARRFEFLEGRAREMSLEPLSLFGWADDLSGQQLAWHDATRALATVAALLEVSASDPELKADLTRLHEALTSAHEVKAPFCLLLLHGQSTSGWQMDTRRGNFGWLSRSRET